METREKIGSMEGERDGWRKREDRERYINLKQNSDFDYSKQLIWMEGNEDGEERRERDRER